MLACRSQDYRKYTIPTDIRGNFFPTDLCGKVFPTDLGGKSSPTGDLGKIRTLLNVAICFVSYLYNLIFCIKGRSRLQRSTILFSLCNKLPNYELTIQNCNHSLLLILLTRCDACILHITNGLVFLSQM
jgi:hypothetical protein